MSPEKQRIAIAEVCGWNIVQTVPGGDLLGQWEAAHNYDAEVDMADGAHGSTATKAMDKAGTPDFLNDLNAMHEAEKVLDFSQQATFLSELASVLGETISFADGARGKADFFIMVHATPAQRAEAFLKTIGKWEEES